MRIPETSGASPASSGAHVLDAAWLWQRLSLQWQQAATSLPRPSLSAPSPLACSRSAKEPPTTELSKPTCLTPLPNCKLPQTSHVNSRCRQQYKQPTYPLHGLHLKLQLPKLHPSLFPAGPASKRKHGCEQRALFLDTSAHFRCPNTCLVFTNTRTISRTLCVGFSSSETLT